MGNFPSRRRSKIALMENSGKEFSVQWVNAKRCFNGNADVGLKCKWPSKRDPFRGELNTRFHSIAGSKSRVQRRDQPRTLVKSWFIVFNRLNRGSSCMLPLSLYRCLCRSTAAAAEEVRLVVLVHDCICKFLTPMPPPSETLWQSGCSNAMQPEPRHKQIEQI